MRASICAQPDLFESIVQQGELLIASNNRTCHGIFGETRFGVFIVVWIAPQSRGKSIAITGKTVSIFVIFFFFTFFVVVLILVINILIIAKIMQIQLKLE
jgi:hypothetical protein